MSKDEEPSTTKDASNKSWFEANCHCAKVRYRIRLPPLQDKEVIICNCSLCTRDAPLLLHPPRVDFHLYQGQETLTGYAPNYDKSCGEHMFCSNCGSSVYTDMHMSDPEPDLVAINLRMFKDIDIEKLKIKYFDGRSLKPPYDP